MPGTPFGGKREGELDKLFMGPNMGQKGTYGPSMMPGDADKLDTTLHMSFSPSRRFRPSREADSPGPGAYGPPVSESLFLDPSLKPGASDLARSRTLTQRLRSPTTKTPRRRRSPSPSP